MTQPRRLTQEQAGDLLRRLQARDERALAELYDHVAPWVLGVAFKILRDDDEAEEVLGDVFVQVWKNIGQHDASRGPLVPWMLSIARNRALDLVRRRRRWKKKAERFDLQRAAEAGDAAPAPAPAESSVPGYPVHREVHAALAALPADQRQVVLLAYFEGLSHSEIAKRLSQPLGTVKTRLRTAQQKLADTLRHVRDWMR